MKNLVSDNRYMEFRLDDQLYAVPLLTVKEVIQKPDVTAVPNMPTHFEGIMNLRGQILGVYSAHKKLNLKKNKHEKNCTDVVMVIEYDDAHIGMIVDEVTKVLHVEETMIRSAPVKQSDTAKAYIKSVIENEKDLILIVDVQGLLDLPKGAHKSAA